jgi:hypothetical protein
MSDETKPGADIVADAREWLARYAGRVTTHSDGCHRWHDACLVARLVAECDRRQITDAERWALEYFAAFHRSPREGDSAAAATLRRLLERLRPDGSGYTFGISAGAGSKPTLTDAEREAVEVAAEAYAADHGERFAATLRAMLGRFSTNGDFPEQENNAKQDKCKALTDSERTAIEGVIEDYEYDGEPGSGGCVATLRGLLSRTGSIDAKTNDETTEANANSANVPERERFGSAANSQPILRDGCGECLTDAEREAAEWAIDALSGVEDLPHGRVVDAVPAADTLRGLLERLG